MPHFCAYRIRRNNRVPTNSNLLSDIRSKIIIIMNLLYDLLILSLTDLNYI